MTVTTESYTPTEAVAAIDPALGVYPFVYPNIGAESIEVWEELDTGARTLVPVNDYTLVLTGSAPMYTGGEITMSIVHPANTAIASVERNTPLTQLINLGPYSRFPPEVIEFGLDKLTLIAQEIEYRKCSCEETLELA